MRWRNDHCGPGVFSCDDALRCARVPGHHPACVVHSMDCLRSGSDPSPPPASKNTYFPTASRQRDGALCGIRSNIDITLKPIVRKVLRSNDDSMKRW